MGVGPAGAWRCHRRCLEQQASSRDERLAPGARAPGAFFCSRGGEGRPGGGAEPEGRGRETTAGGGISDGRRDSSRWGAICLGSPADPVVGGWARSSYRWRSWGGLPHRSPDRHQPATALPNRSRSTMASARYRSTTCAYQHSPPSRALGTSLDTNPMLSAIEPPRKRERQGAPRIENQSPRRQENRKAKLF